MFRAAHISDLHLSKVSLSPFQFFSKRWVGNMNLLFKRRKIHKEEALDLLPELFSELKINYIFITGDISCTSQQQEFLKAENFFKKFMGIKTLFLPGNHDNYTKKSYKQKIFYNYFTNTKKEEDYPAKNFSLRTDGIEIHPLNDNWWYIGLDTTLATSILSSRGFFSHKIEENLKKVLSILPKDISIILANHFPFTQHISQRKRLQRASELRNLFQHFPQIKLYVNGHTHSHCVADLRNNNLPIVVDSGSCSHSKIGSWNLLEFSKTNCSITPYNWKNESWKESKEQRFSWDH
jgi:3',5'-cyclic AMP phosphodiesterase CpdA